MRTGNDSGPNTDTLRDVTTPQSWWKRPVGQGTVWPVVLSWTHRELAPTLARRLRGFRVLGYALGVGVVVVPVVGLADSSGLIDLSTPQMRGICLLWLWMLPPLLLVSIVLEYLYVRRIRKGVRDADYGVCLQCGFLLAGLPPKYKCPECGSPYDIEDVRATWRKWF